MTYLPQKLYDQIVGSIPIICVDIVPVNSKNGKKYFGVIERKTGPEAGKLALIGGRVYKDEKIIDAIKRTLVNDLSVDRFSFYKCEVSHPIVVEQYMNTDEIEGNYLYDSTKHAISLIYAINIDQAKIKPKNEASDFLWINGVENRIFAYGQNEVIKYFLDYFEA